MRAVLLICSLALALTTTLTPSSFAQQKSAKACRQEWQANKAENQARGITEKAYVADCRKGKVAEPATTTATPAPRSVAPAPPSAPPARAAAQPGGANQFSSEAQAKARCPGTTVVWANLKSKVYHFAGTKNYGHTQSGAYMCEQDAQSAGMRAAKNEKHPS